MPLIGIVAFALAAFLVWRVLRQYSLEEIAGSVRDVPGYRLALALACAAGSYASLTLFDALGVRYAGYRLPYRCVALTSFCSLSLGHTIGFAALSSGTIRYRFYSEFGVRGADVARIVLFCALTVGLGLTALGGLALLLQPALAVEVTGLPRGTILGLGAVCLLAILAYVALAQWRRAPLRLYGWELRMPPLPLALAQIGVGTMNFAFVAGALYHSVAASTELGYLTVAATYVIANVATLLSHVPGGLGVIESVVLALIPGAGVIGGLLAFRAAYFWLPLLLGAATLAAFELQRRQPGDAVKLSQT